jgi:hypothetical protein
MHQKSAIAPGFVLALLLAKTLSPAVAANPHDAVRTWRKAHEQAILGDFVTLLSMPNVATNVADVPTTTTISTRKTRICDSAIGGTELKSTRACWRI